MVIVTLVLAVAAGAWCGPAGAASAPALDGAERQAQADTLQQALEANPAGRGEEWFNPDTGRSGAVTPTRAFTDARGRPCREYVATVVLGGTPRRHSGTACRQPDGRWRVLPERVVPLPPEGAPVRAYPPPARYYAYPPQVFAPYRIYLSFGTVLRGGRFYRGTPAHAGPGFRFSRPPGLPPRLQVLPRDPGAYSRRPGAPLHRERPGKRRIRREP